MTSAGTGPATDSIIHTLLLSAPLEQVWNAITDSGQFAEWYRFTLHGPFRLGELTTGHLDSRDYGRIDFDIRVVAVEPMRLFAFEWHPFSVHANIDYSQEPRTRIEFQFAPEGDRIRLTMTESGFDGIPAYRREEAFRMNSGGWSAHLESLYVFLGEHLR